MKEWIVREKIPVEASNELSSFSPEIQSLLFYRGIDSREKAERFFAPSYENDLHDPFLLSDMEKGVARILRAIAGGERIAVFADYDADGIPGSVVLHDFFKKIGYENFEIYIPHRYKEGYGLNKEALKILAGRGAKLIITVDCGITNNAEVEYANTLGMEVIITDHHLPDVVLPPAYAVINPNKGTCTYPNKQLCGGGLAYKLVQALVARGNFNAGVEGWEKWLLDVAGISTISDMVSLTGENRAIATFGLSVLRKGRRLGIAKLFEKKRLSLLSLDEEDIAFTVTPHINAASRMSEPRDAFHMLSTTDAIEANEIVAHLISKNNGRKTVVATIVRECEALLAAVEPRAMVYAGSSSWQPGILGLAAQRIMEKYNRPVCLWGMEGSTLVRGSCRSDGTVNVVELMGEVEEFLEHKGGHEFSGGFSLHAEKTDELGTALLTAYESVKRPAEQNIYKTMYVDAVKTLSDATFSFLQSIAALKPFGMGNPKPLFLFEKLCVLSVKPFGKGKEHLEISVGDSAGKKRTGIYFFPHPEDAQVLQEGEYVDVCAHIEKNQFGKAYFPRLRVVGARKAVL
jgi:single-stranded-DNA-specific exonuclease